MRVAYQGEPGAYSEIAAERVGTPLARRSFEAVFEAVAAGDAELGALPLENSLGGSVHRNYERSRTPRPRGSARSRTSASGRAR